MKKLLLFLMLITSVIGSWATVIKVNGLSVRTDVVSEVNRNHTDAITSGRVVWDPSKNVILLDNLNMNANTHAIEVDGTSDIRIELKGTNVINVTGARYGMNLNGTATYTIASYNEVPNSLIITNTNGNSATASIRAGRPLTVDHCNLTLIAPNAIRGNNTPLTLKEANIKATGADAGSVTSFSAINLEYTRLQDYKYDQSLKAVVDKSGNLVKSLVYFYRDYPIFLKDASIQVTDLNKNDILGDGGSMYYTEYGYAGGILHIKDNANINFGTAVLGLKFDDRYGRKAYLLVHKDGTLKSGRGTTIQASCPLTIYSDPSNIGKLTINSGETAIGCTSDLEFSNVDVNINAEVPVTNFAADNVNTVTFYSTDATLTNVGAENPAVSGFGNTQFTSCCITSPTSASYNFSFNLNERYFTHFGEMIKNLKVTRGADTVKPTLPANKDIRIESQTSTSCFMRWDAAEDNLTVQDKLLYRILLKVNNETVKKYDVPKGFTSYEITDLEPNTTYTLAMRVVDEAGKYSEYNNLTITTEALVKYDLWVAGKQVTTNNMSNVLEDPYVPTVTFDPETNSLTINNWNCYLQDMDYDYAIVNGITGLEIRGEGRSILQGKKGMIYSTEYFSVIGDGDLDSELTSYIWDLTNPAIYAPHGMSVTNCRLDPYGDIEGGETLYLFKSHLLCKKIAGFDELQYNGCVQKTPVGVVYDTTNKVLATEGTEYIEFDVFREFDLEVAGIPVTSDNYFDILGDGKVQYDFREKILFLDNATIVPEEYHNGVFTTIDNLKIKLIGHNVVYGSYGGSIDSKGKNLIIEGYTPSRSTLVCKNMVAGDVYDGAIYVSTSTKIKNCSIDASHIMGGLDPDGEYGTDDYHELTIDRARINVSDNILHFDNIDLKGSYLKSPQNCSYNAGLMYYVDENRNKLNSLSIEPYILEIKNVGVQDNVEASRGSVTFDPVTRTLNMNNAEINDPYKNAMVLMKIYDDITINVQGQNTLNASENGIEIVAGDLTITGPGSLNIYCNSNALYEPFYDRISPADFRTESQVTLRSTTLNSHSKSNNVYATTTTFNIINSNLRLESENSGISFVYHKVNLKHSKWIQPVGAALGDPFAVWLVDPVLIEAEGTIPGDLDGNGELTINDLTLMVKFLNQSGAAGASPLFDINKDGAFNELDVKALEAFILNEQ